MKQHDIHNDEAIYQQILAELTPGAEEYDKLIAEGKHPAAKMHHTIPYYKYAAAACVLFAVVGGSCFWQTRKEAKPQTQLVAKVEEEKQEPSNEYYQVQVQKDSQLETSATLSHTQKQVRQNRHYASNTLTATQNVQLAEDSVNTSTDVLDQELYLALLAEVEARETQIEQQEQQSMRALFDELIYNIEQQPNRPELSL